MHAENCTSSYQIHVTEVVKDMCDNWTVPFCKGSGQGYITNYYKDSSTARAFQGGGGGRGGNLPRAPS
jgi:hypothetical protein